MSYEQKYLKYKEKYLVLKNLIGGGRDQKLNEFITTILTTKLNINKSTKNKIKKDEIILLVDLEHIEDDMGEDGAGRAVD